jgi:hypothetical protein
MPTLQPLSAAGAVANLYIELPHDLPADDFLLILRFDLVLDGWAATGTMLGQGGYIPLIHGCWDGAAVVLAVCRPGFPAIRSWTRFALAPGKRGSLPLPTPTSRFQFLLEPLDLALQSLILLTQALDLLQRPIQFLLRNKFQGLWIGLPGFRLPAVVRPGHPRKLWHGSAEMSSALLCYFVAKQLPSAGLTVAL